MATTSEAGTGLLDGACTALERVRAQRPRVHCLTNPVAMNLSANLLLAAGAVPSMTPDPAAQGDFVRTSRALLVNLGMLDSQRIEAARAAVDVAAQLGRPWLLDPVKVERSGPRLDLARGLIAAGPALVRCNRDEAGALAGEGEEAWRAFARGQRLVLAVHGRGRCRDRRAPDRADRERQPADGPGDRDGLRGVRARGRLPRRGA